MFRNSSRFPSLLAVKVRSQPSTSVTQKKNKKKNSVVASFQGRYYHETCVCVCVLGAG